jgi:hypothetical protein
MLVKKRRRCLRMTISWYKLAKYCRWLFPFMGQAHQFRNKKVIKFQPVWQLVIMYFTVWNVAVKDQSLRCRPTILICNVFWYCKCTGHKIYDFRISTAASAKQTEDQKHHQEQRCTFVIARLISRYVLLINCAFVVRLNESVSHQYCVSWVCGAGQANTLASPSF